MVYAVTNVPFYRYRNKSWVQLIHTHTDALLAYIMFKICYSTWVIIIFICYPFITRKSLSEVYTYAPIHTILSLFASTSIVPPIQLNIVYFAVGGAIVCPLVPHLTYCKVNCIKLYTFFIKVVPKRGFTWFHRGSS